MKIFFVVLLFLYSTKLFANGTCKKCDINKVAIVNDHLDSLNYEMVLDFLCTFDSVCNTNIEYSEWSNEILYKILEKSPTLFFKAVIDPKIDNKQILKEIEKPILDFNFQIIYDRVKATNLPFEIKTKYLNALIIGAAYDDFKIKH